MDIKDNNMMIPMLRSTRATTTDQVLTTPSDSSLGSTQQEVNIALTTAQDQLANEIGNKVDKTATLPGGLEGVVYNGTNPLTSAPMNAVGISVIGGTTASPLLLVAEVDADMNEAVIGAVDTQQNLIEALAVPLDDRPTYIVNNAGEHNVITTNPDRMAELAITTSQITDFSASYIGALPTTLSTDSNNALQIGSDGKLFIPPPPPAVYKFGWQPTSWDGVNNAYVLFQPMNTDTPQSWTFTTYGQFITLMNSLGFANQWLMLEKPTKMGTNNNIANAVRWNTNNNRIEYSNNGGSSSYDYNSNTTAVTARSTPNVIANAPLEGF